ncbi:APC family permease [Paenibacillus sp. IB182496]|uniref:APC family permease n=1 Tax=Paenibacillus sabuli TaxID=2772509 RepID=A0A927BXX1_9BACL|nr:APC family permease [Paenibacillus sabuli]MBD2847358.1 APC family permease [Paenibacillus sabuli]
MSSYRKGSLSLIGAIGLGTGVMISAGIFALLGQVAELAGAWFPLMFLTGGLVAACSAYSYIRLSHAYPSAGGIGMFLVKAYGKGTAAAAASLLMAISMVINQSLVARTFGTYTLQLFEGAADWLVPALGAGLLIGALLINLAGNRFIQSFTSAISLLKIAGLLVFVAAGLLAAGFVWTPAEGGAATGDAGPLGAIASIALTILAFKGFTTITNSGAEIVRPRRNIGLAILIAIAISLAVYLLLAWTVSSSLPLDRIIAAKDYALAEAARPALGDWGVWLTVAVAIVATVSGMIASVFAVSRMLAMLTEMKLIPHRHFRMPGTVQQHTLVYTVALALLLTILLDLSRIASMGAILYLVMDMMVHWGLLRRLRGEVSANTGIVVCALVLDGLVLAAFTWYKLLHDPLIVAAAGLSILLVFLGERFFLRRGAGRGEPSPHHEDH